MFTTMFLVTASLVLACVFTNLLVFKPLDKIFSKIQFVKINLLQTASCSAKTQNSDLATKTQQDLISVTKAFGAWMVLKPRPPQ